MCSRIQAVNAPAKWDSPLSLGKLKQILTLLKSPLAYDVFIPTIWAGIRMTPYHLEVKPGLPEFLKPHTRPVREALY